MGWYEEILRMRRDADRILAPLRDFDRLYGRGVQNVVQDLIRQEQVFRAALPDFSSSFRMAMESIQPALDFLELDRQSVEIASVVNAHRSLSAILVRQADFQSIARASTVLSYHWRDSIAIYERLGAEAAAAELALKSHYAAVAESAILAQERLFRVPWDSLGSATAIAGAEFVAVRAHFTELTDTYRSLMQSFEESEHFMASFPPIISGEPPREIVRSASVLASLSKATSSPELAEGEGLFKPDFEEEDQCSIDELLDTLDPDLSSIWLGAREALRSENPDRGRHVVVSLRELITHALDTVAPISEVQGWTSDPSHFHQGRPTREARILFACRGVNHGPFARFVNADVRATIEFISLFQRGTHELAASFSETQLRALVTRTESLLRFLLLVSGITP